jgi:hypothetical protein
VADKYDAAIAWFSTVPADQVQYEIEQAWMLSEPHPAGCLFQFCQKDGFNRAGAHEKQCGCLVMIRQTNSGYQAATLELTAAIKADSRIPTASWMIRLEHLPVFAEWQRRLDMELGRVG